MSALDDDVGLEPDDAEAVDQALMEVLDDAAARGREQQYVDIERATSRNTLSARDQAILSLRALRGGDVSIEPARRADGPPRGSTRPTGHADVDLLRVYIRDAGATPLLTANEEAQLARVIESGARAQGMLAAHAGELRGELRKELESAVDRAEEGRRRFLSANLRLVFSIAKTREGQGLELLDLIQEGTLGLIRALEKFDYTLGFKFSTYATWWIRQAIDRAVADKGRTIRLPVHVHEQIRKMRTAERTASRELGREATVFEIAERIGKKPEEVQFLRDISVDVLSLDAPIRDESGSITVADRIESRDPTLHAQYIENETVEEVHAALEQLGERNRDILRLRFGVGVEDNKPLTLEELGQLYGLTRERIRQIETQATNELREKAMRLGWSA